MSRPFWSQPQCPGSQEIPAWLEWELVPLKTRDLRAGLGRTGKTQTNNQPALGTRACKTSWDSGLARSFGFSKM